MTIKLRTDSRKNLLLNFSPWILATACTLLLLLLVTFAVSNYQRERALIIEALTEKGSTLIRFINSSARESIRDNLRSTQQWSDWQNHMKAAMDQAIEQPGVEFVLLADSDGNILSAAGNQLLGNMLDGKSKTFISTLNSRESVLYVTRIVESNQGGSKKFQLAARYRPPNMGLGMQGSPGGGQGGRMMMQRFSRHPQYDMVQGEMNRLLDLRPIYIIQLDIDQFTSPLKRQFLQIIILLVVFVLVGTGGALSFATLRGLKGSQLRLGKMRAFTDILVSSLPIGLIATDSFGAVQICNNAASELIGVDETTLVGKKPSDCLPQELAQLFTGNKTGAETSRQLEMRLTLGPEVVKTLQLASMIAYEKNGDFTGEVLLIRDLTTVKHLEKELQRSERLAALGKMAAGIAHELRNPLSSIKGLALILKSNFPVPSKEAESADILVKEVERLNRSIGELLDYAKPGQLLRESVAIAEVVGKTVSLVQLDAESFGIVIHFEVKEVLANVYVDKDKMNQVFLNLLLNAIQAMEHGGELLVRVENSSSGIQIIIRDNGIGIAPENLARVFDPYFTTKNQGTGLGLALSSKIIEEHGGTMELSSTPGEYTEVRIVLPVEGVGAN